MINATLPQLPVFQAVAAPLTYTFDLPAGTTATVKAEVLYRPACKELRPHKAWKGVAIPTADYTLHVHDDADL